MNSSLFPKLEMIYMHICPQKSKIDKVKFWRAVIFKLWIYVLFLQCENNKLLWRHVNNCVQGLRFERNMSYSENTMALTLNMDFFHSWGMIIYLKYFYSCFALVKISIIMSNVWFKFHIQHQTIEFSPYISPINLLWSSHRWNCG